MSAPSKNVKRDIRFRVYVAFTCICLLGLAVILKAASIQQRHGDELRALGGDFHLRTDTIRAERGNIYTEEGQLLCSTIPQFDIRLDLTVVKRDTFNKYLDTLSSGIARILGNGTPATYRAKLKKAYQDSARYYALCRNISYTQFQELRALPVFRKGARRGGFIPESKIKRINPHGMLAYRTIGLWRENAQLVGLEATYDSVLAGANGRRVLQKVTGGVMMPVEGAAIEARNGQDIVTTLSLPIQNVAEHAMMAVLKKYESLNGTCIVMEVETGKIRALVNLGRQEDGSYKEDFNYALLPSEPGSTFKATTLLSLLNDGYIKVDDIVDCEGGAIRFGNRILKDSHLGLGSLSIRDAYAHSSNTAMAKLAWQHYSKDQTKYIKHLEALHLDERTGIDLKGERKPYMMKPGSKHWNNNTTMPWMATGYGVLITPLHTCMIYNAIANNGRMMKPYLVSGIRENGRLVKTINPTVLEEKIGDSSAIAQLQSCVKEVVLTGTGKHIKSPFYSIAGKTGTAQVADRIGGRWYTYRDGVYQGSFVGYFPADKPKYTMIVLIRTKPHSGAYYGGTIAAPVFRMVSDRIFSLSNGGWNGPLDSLSRITQKRLQALSATGSRYRILLESLGLKAQHIADDAVARLTLDSSSTPKLLPQPVQEGIVPDVTNMALPDALYLLENQGLSVQVAGRGRIRSQSLPAGSRAVRGQSIVLQLS